MPDFKFEKMLFPKVSGLIFGFDEAGRGPWCGPVVAACVCWPNYQIPDDLSRQINDSKKLSAKKRSELYDLITHSNALIGVGKASAEEIDSLNILQATFLAMHRAAQACAEKGYAPAAALIDGNRLPAEWAIPCHCLIAGDSLSLSVAAASIVAKVTRDRIMSELSRFYPEYNWNKNAGYGTKDHRIALEKFGVTEHHRKSYAPIAKLLRQHSSC